MRRRGDDDTRSKIVRRNPARGSERRRFDSVRGRRAKGVIRGMDIVERSGGAKGVDVVSLK